MSMKSCFKEMWHEEDYEANKLILKVQLIALAMVGSLIILTWMFGV